MRDRKYLVIGAILSLLFTVGLISHLSGADTLAAFSQPVEHKAVPIPEASLLSSVIDQSDGLEKILGPIKPKEDGFT